MRSAHAHRTEYANPLSRPSPCRAATRWACADASLRTCADRRPRMQGNGLLSSMSQASGMVGTYTCASGGWQVAEVATEFGRSEAIQVVRVKDRFAKAAMGGWRDIMINYVLSDDPDGHVCEIQIAHRQMLLQREGMKAHDTYDRTRNASELCEKLDCHLLQDAAQG